MKRKQLRCPICGARLIDTVPGNVSELLAEEKIQTGWNPDYFQKCTKCKNQIGIRKVS